MRKFTEKVLPWILTIVLFIGLIPSVITRVKNEQANKNVAISLLYNDIRNKVSSRKLENALEEYKKLGVNKVTIMEDDVNALVARGEVTCIKYNVLCHKYDDESMEIADIIKKNHPEVAYDSYLVMVKKPEVREKVGSMIPRKFGKEDYVKISGIDEMDIYAFLNGREDLWNISLGFDEKVIADLYEKGFEIVLSYKMRNYENLSYLEDIRKIAKEYDVKYFNLKEAAKRDKKDEEIKEENYEEIAKIIKELDMTLVVTENVNQLSNQKGFGYDYVYNQVIKDGEGKVLRSYETYDESQADETYYLYRTNQFFNSTMDRNIRFITVTQIAPLGITYDDGVDYTLKALGKYIDDIKASGFTVNGEENAFSYKVNPKFNAGIAAAIIIMLMYLALYLIRKKTSLGLFVAALVLSLLAFLGTYIIPDTLRSLYPTVFCVAVSSFAMTLVMRFVKDCAHKLNTIVLTVAAVLIMVAVLSLGVLGMCSLLSGIDYYINNLIFRGIKITLMLPLLYTAAVYYFMFLKEDKKNIFNDLGKMLNANIKVYWVILGGIIGAIGLYYIIRSGNVNSISSLELAMRNAITETFPARPRTKEFLIGYPSLVLFCYYVKNTRIDLFKWIFAIGASILAASVTNTFCHVFTDVSVMYMRVVNGLLIGFIVSLFVFVGNLALVRIYKLLTEKYRLHEKLGFSKDTEMK